MSEDDEFFHVFRGKLPPSSPSKEYARFNEVEDALISFDLVALVTPLVRKKPSYWKWVIMGAHNALQGAMVCALADTIGASVLEKESARLLLEYLESPEGKQPPEEKLAVFFELLKRCKRQKIVTLSTDEMKDIRRFHRHFRNNFAHFTPKGWSIEKAGLPRIVGAALHAAEQLMNRPRVVLRMSGNNIRRLKKSLESSRASLGSSG